MANRKESANNQVSRKGFVVGTALAGIAALAWGFLGRRENGEAAIAAGISGEAGGCDGRNDIGRVYRDESGDVYMCNPEGEWVKQDPDSGILVDEGKVYKRMGEIPGNYDETYRFSHWAGEITVDEEGNYRRTACYSAADGLGCDMKYIYMGQAEADLYASE